MTNLKYYLDNFIISEIQITLIAWCSNGFAKKEESGVWVWTEGGEKNILMASCKVNSVGGYKPSPMAVALQQAYGKITATPIAPHKSTNELPEAAPYLEDESMSPFEILSSKMKLFAKDAECERFCQLKQSGGIVSVTSGEGLTAPAIKSATTIAELLRPQAGCGLRSLDYYPQDIRLFRRFYPNAINEVLVETARQSGIEASPIEIASWLTTFERYYDPDFRFNGAEPSG